MKHLNDHDLQRLVESGHDDLHLRECPSCSDEVALYRRLFARLALVPEVVPPADFASGVMAAIASRTVSWREAATILAPALALLGILLMIARPELSALPAVPWHALRTVAMSHRVAVAVTQALYGVPIVATAIALLASAFLLRHLVKEELR